MENYFKGKNVEEEIERSKIPIKDLPENFLWMQVKGGSKMTNLLSHVSGILEDKSANTVVWSGAGVAIPKAISCAEIIKRQFSIKHQVTKLTYKKGPLQKSTSQNIITKLISNEDWRTLMSKSRSGVGAAWKKSSVGHLISIWVDEYWEPKMEGLETIVVKRQIPVIHIMLSTEPILDTNQPGYQTLQGKKFWQKEQSSSNQQQSHKSRKPFKQKKQTPV